MLTAHRWLVVITFTLCLVIFIITHIHPFLAVNSSLKANVLVVEGWLPDYALKDAIAEFKSGAYHKIITTGGPLPIGFYLAEYNNFADLSAATLRTLGLEEEKLIAVPAPDVIKKRTYASAVALRQWLSSSDLKVETINLFTCDVHARRSWLIFKQVLAPKIKAGVIAVESQDYEPKNWWSSSAGVRAVIFETIAYIYTRFVNLQIG